MSVTAITATGGGTIQGGLEINTSSDLGHLNIPSVGAGTLNGVAIGSTSGKEQTGAFTTVTATGILPDGDNTRDLGSGLARWRNLYTGDLHLSNEGGKGNDVDKTTGDWTIQEGEDDLYLFNNKSGKKYKFKLEEL